MTPDQAKQQIIENIRLYDDGKLSYAALVTVVEETTMKLHIDSFNNGIAHAEDGPDEEQVEYEIEFIDDEDEDDMDPERNN